MRIYPEFEALFRTQVRALIRASAHGSLRVMLPMISTVEEVRWAREIISEEQARCGAEQISFDPAMQIGAMIEVPSAAFAIQELFLELDFFSIGSNDLLQYFMAVDRANSRVASLYNPLQPTFSTIAQANRGNRPSAQEMDRALRRNGRSKTLSAAAGRLGTE